MNAEKSRVTEQKMLSKVDAALAAARKAGAEYEVSAMRIEQTVSRTTVNLNSQSSLNDLRNIVRDCASACDKLYLAYQNLIRDLDTELRGCLAQEPGAYAVKAVTGTITWLNEESRIQNNYAAQFDGIDLGQLVKKEYLPRPENLETERYWKAQYNALPDKGDAESRWAEKLREHKRLASEEESKARSNELKSRQEARNIMRTLAQQEKEEVEKELEKKKTEFRSQYSEICKRIEYCRPAADILHFNTWNYGYVTQSGMLRIEHDENYRGCNIRKMHDLKQVVCISAGVIGLGNDGRCQLSNIDADSLEKCGLGSCLKWKNVKKLAACEASNQVIGLLEDGHCVATTPDYDAGVHYVSGWSDIVDIVCDQYYAAGLRKDGTVVVSGRGNLADNLRKMTSGWKDIIAIFPYNTWYIAALKKDGTVLPDIPEFKEPASSAKNIIAVAKNTNGPVFLQADGTVIATKSCSLTGWGGKKTEGYSVSGLKNVIAVYTGKHHFAALCEDGMLREYDHYNNSLYELNKGAPIFRSYKDYWNEVKEKEKEAQLRADRRKQGLCQHCGGKLEKKLFVWKCAGCGQRKDY